MPDPRQHNKTAQAIIYSDSTDRDYALKVRLTNEGFQLTFARGLDALVALCRRNRPDIVIVRSLAMPREVVKILKQLSANGMNFSSYPTFLLVRGHVAKFLTPLLEIGLADIIDLDEGLEILMSRIKELRGRSSDSANGDNDQPRSQSGSRGNLTDMSIIDLIQALGPSQKTTRITVTPENASLGSLLVYLNRGNISFAKLGDLLAEKAIYEALAWSRGTWLLEPITDDDLPEPNNNLPNEFILMEGCRLIDENSREAAETAASTSSKS